MSYLTRLKINGIRGSIHYTPDERSEDTIGVLLRLQYPFVDAAETLNRGRHYTNAHTQKTPARRSHTVRYATTLHTRSYVCAPRLVSKLRILSRGGNIISTPASYAAPPYPLISKRVVEQTNIKQQGLQMSTKFLGSVVENLSNVYIYIHMQGSKQADPTP